MEANLMFTLEGVKRSTGRCDLHRGRCYLQGNWQESESGEKSGELTDRVQQSIEDEIRIAVRAVQILDGF